MRPGSAGWLLLAIWLCAPASLLAQKTDVVQMANGDRITCEITRLDRGILEVSTDSLGTVSIEWADVRRVTSAAHFEVQLDSGARFSGSLDAAADGQVQIVGDTVQTVAIAEIVFMQPVEGSFLDQLDGSIDVGYSFASAGASTQWSLSTDIVRRREGSDARFFVDSFFSAKEGADDVSRHTAYVEFVRRTGRRWGVLVMGQAQRNDELSLQLRAQAGAGVVRHFVQTNRMILLGYTGLVFNNEIFTDDTPSTRTWEAVFGSQFEWFIFNSPKTRVINHVALLPNLSTGGRVRFELNTSVRRELLKDLFINLSLVDSFDSKPPVQDARRHDLALVTSLGWSF